MSCAAESDEIRITSAEVAGETDDTVLDRSIPEEVIEIVDVKWS